MPGLIISEETIVPKVTVSEDTNVSQVSAEEEAEFPNRIGVNGRHPYIGQNKNWWSYDDITRLPYDTGVAATDEELLQLVDGLSLRVDTIEESISEILQKPDEVQEFETYFHFPNLGKSKVIYIDLATNKSYRWDAENLKYYTLNDESFDIINGGE
ncbi:MAG: hypothetical protein AB9922_12400 [Bacteroidales bacterium]